MLDHSFDHLRSPTTWKKCERLIEITEALLNHKGKSAEDVFGYVDALKLKSSMTLFSLISEDGSVFHLAIDQFFGGKNDTLTLEILGISLSAR